MSEPLKQYPPRPKREKSLVTDVPPGWSAPSPRRQTSEALTPKSLLRVLLIFAAIIGVAVFVIMANNDFRKDLKKTEDVIKASEAGHAETDRILKNWK